MGVWCLAAGRAKPRHPHTKNPPSCDSTWWPLGNTVLEVKELTPQAGRETLQPLKPGSGFTCTA